MHTLIPQLLAFQNSIKLYHWSTTVFARHMASDKLLKELSPLIDRLVELYLGKYARPVFKKQELSVQISQPSEKAVQDLCEEMIKRCIKEVPQDPELINVRDEIIGAIRQALYLFTLR